MDLQLQSFISSFQSLGATTIPPWPSLLFKCFVHKSLEETHGATRNDGERKAVLPQQALKQEAFLSSTNRKSFGIRSLPLTKSC